MSDTLPPHDWDTPSPHHGFSKSAQKANYFVVLSLNGKQTRVCSAQSKHDAALFYDLALKFLLPFTPATARPNFTQEFANWTDEEILRRIPTLSNLFQRCKDVAELQGRDVETLRTLRAKQVEAGRAKANDAVSRARTNQRKGYDKLIATGLRAAVMKSDVMAALMACGRKMTPEEVGDLNAINHALDGLSIRIAQFAELFKPQS